MRCSCKAKHTFTYTYKIGTQAKEAKCDLTITSLRLPYGCELSKVAPTRSKNAVIRLTKPKEPTPPDISL